MYGICLNKKIAIVMINSIMAIFFLNCRHIKENIGVNLVFSYPIMQLDDGKITSYKLTDTIPIVYYGDYILYHLPKTRILETDSKVQDDTTFFLHQRDSSYGFLFKPAPKTLFNRMAVDSFLQQRAFAGANFQNTPNDTLIETINNENGDLIEKYVPREKNEIYFDSLFFYYTNNLKSIDFSFSKKMDSLKGMKLFKVRLINNEGYSHQYNTILPKREFFFELYQMSEDSLKNYIHVIKKYTIPQ